MSQLSNVFALNRTGLNVRRGVALAAVPAAPVVVFGALHKGQYRLSVTCGLLFVVLSDPGGHHAHRARTLAFVGVVGALLTAIAFSLGTGVWGLIVLAALSVSIAMDLPHPTNLSAEGRRALFTLAGVGRAAGDMSRR